jgi:AbrB family looped-hinge helix DNA binding protein
MATTITTKGQVTIPKRVRDAVGLKPGDNVDFIIGDSGEVVLRRAGPESGRPTPDPDRFEKVRGTAFHKWPSTDEYMKFIRGDDYGQD